MLTRLRRSGLTWDWLCAFACYGLIIAPFGCEISNGPLPDPVSPGALDPNGPGLILNQDLGSRAVLGARGANGDELFAYGERTSSGGLRSIAALVVRTSEGESSLIFDGSGRPVLARGPDGSSAEIVYSQVSIERIEATVTLRPAGEPVTSFSVVINPLESLESIEQGLFDATGQQFEGVDVNDAANLVSKAKSSPRSAEITITSPLFGGFLVPFFAGIGLVFVLIGQVFLAVIGAVAVALQYLVIAIFSPFLILGALLKGATVNIEVLPLSALFGNVPGEPDY